MAFQAEEFEILNKLVGAISVNTANSIEDKIDCFLHHKVSMFMPSSGQCEYAISPSHTHPAYSFIYNFQPVEEIIIDGKNVSYDLSEGKCLCVLSPDVPHQEVIQENFQSYIAVMIDAEFFEETAKQYMDTIRVYKGEIFVPHTELLSMLRCFMIEASNSKNKNSELMEHLASVIVHLAVQSLGFDKFLDIPLYNRFEVDCAIAYMNSHISEKITVEILAEQVKRSTGHFSKIFKSITGVSPMDFLSNLRIQKAHNLLISSMKSITEIAMECGFNTSSYFSSCFLEKFKMTPSAYRNNSKIKTNSPKFDK